MDIELRDGELACVGGAGRTPGAGWVRGAESALLWWIEKDTNGSGERGAISASARLLFDCVRVALDIANVVSCASSERISSLVLVPDQHDEDNGETEDTRCPPTLRNLQHR